MGTKQTKPMIDVHIVQQRLPRSEQLYLKNLFLLLVQLGGGGGSAAQGSSPGGHLNQSLSSSALASPSNSDLLALRLSRHVAVAYLLTPAFPGISVALAERFFALFAYNGSSSGTAIDYSEYLVMMYTLWYGHSHEELHRLAFALFDVQQSGRVGRKDYRKVAQALLEEYSSKVDGVAPSSSSASSASGGFGASGASSRTYLHAIFDFYFHLALFAHDRDHDQHLVPGEFAALAEEDLLLVAIVHGRKDPRQAKQQLNEMLGLGVGVSGRDPLRPASDQKTSAGLAASAVLAASRGSGTLTGPPPAALSQTRNFLGEEEVEETSGDIWRRQRRSEIKNQVRKTELKQSPQNQVR